MADLSRVLWCRYFMDSYSTYYIFIYDCNVQAIEFGAIKLMTWKEKNNTKKNIGCLESVFFFVTIRLLF